MRVDPKKLRGSYSIGAAALMVLGTASLIGMAGMGSLQEVGVAAGAEPELRGAAVSIAPQPLYVGARVAVFLSRGGSSASTLLIESAKVSRVKRGSVVLDVGKKQEMILAFARALGELRYVQISESGPSPYAGEGVESLEELQKVLNSRR
jgi:hypothetical protein